MYFPSFIKRGDTIGVCAPSFGIATEPYLSRCKNFIIKMKNQGLKVVESEHVYTLEKARSCSAKQRAKEFTEMWLNPEISMIFSVAGGEFMMEILPYLDFNLLKTVKPKWFQGYSDNTNLVFPLLTFLETASIYSICATEFGSEIWHKSLTDNFNFLLGENKIVESFEKYEIESFKKNPGMELCSYNLTENTSWKCLTDQEKVKFSGRMIGGCLESLNVLCGTKFDNVKEFIEKYKNDGFIWFLEACEINVIKQQCYIWQLKHAGWFKYCKGFIIGRSPIKESVFDCTYEEAYFTPLKDLNVPIILDCDFGHTNPKFHIVSGSLATVSFENGKGKIKYDLI